MYWPFWKIHRPLAWSICISNQMIQACMMMRAFKQMVGMQRAWKLHIIFCTTTSLTIHSQWACCMVPISSMSTISVSCQYAAQSKMRPFKERPDTLNSNFKDVNCSKTCKLATHLRNSQIVGLDLQTRQKNKHSPDGGSTLPIEWCNPVW